MTITKLFEGIRPPQNLTEQVASRPYDVLNSEEACAEAKSNEKSLCHVIRPGIDFPVGTDERDEQVYAKAAENFQLFQDKGWLVQGNKENYYIYAQTVNGKTQYGLVVGTHVPDYMSGIIKEHELTRHDKEEDRVKHARVNNANIELVFFVYPDNGKLDVTIEKYTANKPIYDSIAPSNGFGHSFQTIDQDAGIATTTAEFTKMPALYIAGGHYRSVAITLVGAEKAKQNPNHRGNEEYNRFMVVCFSVNQLAITDYNHIARDLSGLAPEQLLVVSNKNFIVEERNADIYKPSGLHDSPLYLGGKWHSLTAKAGTYNDSDPIDVLDITTSSNLILDEVLSIRDLRSDKRINFVGGIRGLGELKKRMDSGGMKVASALCPVSMEQLMDIVDTGSTMPSRTIWFEPELRSGLVTHKLG